MTKKELNKLKNVDIKTVKKEDLVDISTVKIDTDLPVKERVEDYIRQIKNPYCYVNHGIIIKISFAGKSKLEDCIKTALMPKRV